MSTQNIVIVESPSKAKTINKYLGSDYKVLASYGHIRDLPSKNGSVNPENGFAMSWAIEADSLKRIDEIAKSLKGASRLILATDPDREGEAISWHILEVLLEKGVLQGIEVQRVTFNEITKRAVEAAMASPRAIDEQLVQAYLARRALDYLVGFTLSPVLWRKLPGSRSAGRVQSVALRMVVEREKEVEKFIPQEYWSVEADIATPRGEMVSARVLQYDGRKLQKLDIDTQDFAEQIVKEIHKGDFSVLSVEAKPVKRNPPPPFITSTLQQEASRKLGFSATKTMTLAQKLYEGVEIRGETVGLITYMRTDGVSLAQEALEGLRQQIKRDFGDEYVPEKPRFYKSKAKNAQEAHEAIRPTNITLTPREVGFLENDMLRLYTLIWQRTMACQMESAVLERTTIDFSSPHQPPVILRAVGSVLVFPGFLALYQEGKDDEEDEENRRLPRMNVGEAVKVIECHQDEHATEPPPRYSEASLVKRMEELGIGRPSTYASILSVLRDRHYVRFEKGRFMPEDQGRIVTYFLEHYFKTYVEYDFTASLEEKLDLVSDGKLGWTELLTQFWIDFEEAVKKTSTLRISEVIDHLDAELEPYLFPVLEGEGDARLCPTCSEGRLSLKLGKFGAFVGCSRYPDCRHTRPLTTESATAVSAVSQQPLGHEPTTGQDITIKSGRFGPYLQVGEGKEARRVSIPKAFDPANLSLETALQMLSLPRNLGKTATGEDIVAGFGRFGPYIQVGERYVKVKDHRRILALTYEEALALLAQAPAPATDGTAKKTASKTASSSKSKAKAPPPLKEGERELGAREEDGQGIFLRTGRFGPYVTDGEVNATLPQRLSPEEITLTQALDLLTAKMQTLSAKGKAPVKKKTKSSSATSAAAKKKK